MPVYSLELSNFPGIHSSPALFDYLNGGTQRGKGDTGMAKKKQIPELKVLFDTNVLYTQMASDLVKPEVATLITEHSSYTDHKISWHLPAIVRHERQYQMEKAAMQLLPSLSKLEKLLGHNLAINESILKQRVSDAISTHLAFLRIETVDVDPSQVNWPEIILKAAYRRPPFDSGEKEKGFRDALVIESLRQLILQSPVTPTVCRIVLVTEDKLLRQAAEEATTSVQNVRIVADLDELKGLINTLVSEVGEDFIAELLPKAHSHFFVKEDKTTLYYKEDIRKIIKEQFSSELASKPDGVTEMEPGTWYIGKSRFVKKEGQRIFWVNRIEPTFTGYRTASNAPAKNIDDILSPSSPGLSSLAGLFNKTATEKSLVGEFANIFDVNWSITLGQHKKFSAAKIENILFVETKFTEGTQ